MKRFICLHLLPVNKINYDGVNELRNVAIPVERIDEVTDYIDTTICKDNIQSRILMNDGMIYYSPITTQEICNLLN